MSDNEWVDPIDYSHPDGAKPRLHLVNPRDPDNSLTLAFDESGRLHVSVSDEQAVDSYNQLFELSISIPRNIVPQLVEFLSVNFLKDVKP